MVPNKEVISGVEESGTICLQVTTFRSNCESFASAAIALGDQIWQPRRFNFPHSKLLRLA